MVFYLVVLTIILGLGAGLFSYAAMPNYLQRNFIGHMIQSMIGMFILMTLFLLSLNVLLLFIAI